MEEEFQQKVFVFYKSVYDYWMQLSEILVVMQGSYNISISKDLQIFQVRNAYLDSRIMTVLSFNILISCNC